MPGKLPYVPLMEDPSAGHQIVLRQLDGQIVVTCNCQRSRAPIEVRTRWTAAEALKAYRDFHQLRGLAI